MPLYLDSVFDASGQYKFDKVVPRYVNAGLEFYEGASLALDSLNKEGVKLEVQVFDTRHHASLYKLADSGKLNDVDLIIGAVSGSEYLDLATIAKEKQIPFVSASYPNDGGITENPYVIIVNPKLNTHIQAIYNYVLRNLGTNKIVMFRRQNKADDRVTEVIKSLNQSASGPVVNIQTATLNSPFTTADITATLDKSRENVIIGGSLDDAFNKKLITTAASLASAYKITLVGMPTWEGLHELEAPELKAVPVIYPATFFNPEEEDTWSNDFRKQYGRNTYTLPSEMAFRGYEVTYLFSHLLAKYHRDLGNNLSDKNFRVHTDFQFYPVRWSNNAILPDYYENKRIYILKRLDGAITKEY